MAADEDGRTEVLVPGDEQGKMVLANHQTEHLKFSGRMQAG